MWLILFQILIQLNGCFKKSVMNQYNQNMFDSFPYASLAYANSLNMLSKEVFDFLFHYMYLTAI